MLPCYRPIHTINRSLYYIMNFYINIYIYILLRLVPAGIVHWRHEAWTIVVICLVFAASASAGNSPMAPAQLTVVKRRITQDQGAWVIDYCLRYTGQSGVVILAEEVGIRAEGWVSNSRVASHAVPRWCSLAIARGPELSDIADVIPATNDAHRCRERLLVYLSTEDWQPAGHGISRGTKAALQGNKSNLPIVINPKGSFPLSVAPGAIIYARLRFEHQHTLYGDYDPLLSTRSVELKLGPALIRDVIPLDREQYLAHPRFGWPEPPTDRRDTRHFVSPPDSLHMEAHVPGHQCYRYPERPVRYSTKMRLRFWYLIAAGTEGECRVAFAQYKDTPTAWRKLHSGSFDQTLNTVGLWTKIERIIQTEAEATILTLEFKIVGETDVGEMWIDDVSLEPISCATSTGP
jgi:hypothetical protein